MIAPAMPRPRTLPDLTLDRRGLAVRVPLAPLREALADRAPGAKITLEPSPPGLLLRGEAEALGAPITFAARIELEALGVADGRRTLTVRIHDVTLVTPDDAPGPLAAAIRAGDIDVAHPGDLVGNQLGLPAFVSEARGERVVIDLLALPLFEAPIPRALFAVGTATLAIGRVEIEGDSLVLRPALLPAGVRGLGRAIVREAIVPALLASGSGR